MSENSSTLEPAPLPVMRSGELAIAAMAAKAKAEVEARYVIALKNPRNIMQARLQILDACKRPQFAKGARYKKPVGGGKFVENLSIRFAEEAIKCMHNVDVRVLTIHDDEEKRIVSITVTDLETNTNYGDEIVIHKTVERRSLKEGEVKISERRNSNGDLVFLVAATEDSLNNKINAAKSKIIRTNGLRLVPQDILEEANVQILKTLADPKNAGDPKEEVKKVCDAFNNIGVSVPELERYLKHPLDSISPAELMDLRSVYTAIDENETTWAEVCPQEPKGPAHSGPQETPGDLANVVDTAVIEKPYEHLVGLIKEAGDISEAQVHAFMKKNKLCGEKTEELIQASDANMRVIIKTWKSAIGKIRATKVPTT